jgi:hypothetical protein
MDDRRHRGSRTLLQRLYLLLCMLRMLHLITVCEQDSYEVADDGLNKLVTSRVKVLFSLKRRWKELFFQPIARYELG